MLETNSSSIERTSNILPPVIQADHVGARNDDANRTRPSIIPPLSISTGIDRSPSSARSGLPMSHPLSSTSPTNIHERPGYISPPESTTRRSNREEQDPSLKITSLPSIHEALGDRSILNPSLAPTSLPRSSGSNPGDVTLAPTPFTDRPAGPSNPFSSSTPNLPTSATKHSLPVDSCPRSPDTHDHRILGIQRTNFDAKQQPPHNAYQYPVSPRASFSSPTSGQVPPLASSATSHGPSVTPHNPQQSDPTRYAGTAPPYSSQPAARPIPVSHVLYEHGTKADWPSESVPASGRAPPYGDTVKRHLDVYDTEVAFNEINDASLRTLEFSRYWTQRYYQANRSQVIAESIPPLEDVDEALRQCHRTMENLNRVRDVSIVQQTTAAEDRARRAHLAPTEQYRTTTDEYKSGAFAVGDAKKRRGKAAPPGRCHSCNRAETPEWRRGPDGARTLCNACGLHYAKLTRKLGVNKTGYMNASSLRPKGLDDRS